MRAWRQRLPESERSSKDTETSNQTSLTSSQLSNLKQIKEQELTTSLERSKTILIAIAAMNLRFQKTLDALRNIPKN